MKSYQIELQYLWMGQPQYSQEIVVETAEDAIENWYTQNPRFWGRVDFINKTVEGTKFDVVDFKSRIMLI